MLLDSDLAAMYGVTTKRLNEQVRRNVDRFPGDFAFVLTNQEVASLRSQIATLKTGRGTHRKYAQMAFTEHGAIMAATVPSPPRRLPSLARQRNTTMAKAKKAAKAKTQAERLMEVAKKAKANSGGINFSQAMGKIQMARNARKSSRIG